MSCTKQKKNRKNKNIPYVSQNNLIANLIASVREHISIVMGFCLAVIGAFFSFSLTFFFADRNFLEKLFESPYYAFVRVAVIVVLMYTLINTADFVINFILLHLPKELVSNAREDFLLKMNVNVVRYANGNPITAFMIRLFNYVSLSPGIINSPTVNFLMGFVSIFGVVLILFFKQVFLWLFSRFIKPLYQPILNKLFKKKEK